MPPKLFNYHIICF